MFREINGEVVFFPYGRFGGGFVVNHQQAGSINKINLRYMQAGCFLFALALVTRSIWDLIPIGAFLIIYCVHIGMTTKGLKRSSARITAADLLAAQIQEMSFRMLFVLIALSAFFVSLFSLIAVALWGKSVWMSLFDAAIIAISAVGVVQFTIILIAKIRFELKKKRSAGRKLVG